MSKRAHRIKTITYAETTFFKGGSSLEQLILAHGSTNDLRNQDAGGPIEITLRGLKDILEADNLSSEDRESLKEEIDTIVKEGKSDDDFITYDMY